MNNSQILLDKQEFLQKMKLIAPETYQGVADRSLQISSFNGYGVKDITRGNHVRVFESGDITAKGVRNINNGQTPADKHIYLTKIRIRTAKVPAAKCTGKSDEQIIGSIDWDAEPILRTVANGEVTVSAAGSTYIEKQSACIFDHESVTDTPKGEAVIPGKYLKPQSDINIEFDLVGQEALEDGDRLFIRADFGGLMTTKA